MLSYRVHMIESPKRKVHLVSIGSDFDFFLKIFLSHPIFGMALIWIRSRFIPVLLVYLEFEIHNFILKKN